MPIETGQYGKEISDVDDIAELDLGIDTGLIVARSGDAWLLSELNVEDNKGIIESNQLNNSQGRLRLHFDDPDFDGLQYRDQIYDDFRLARLAYALWDRCGPINQPEGSAIPLEVATDSQAAIAAYLRLGNGYPNSREYVAEQIGVTKQTVSNYCQRVRNDLKLDDQEAIQITKSNLQTASTDRET